MDYSDVIIYILIIVFIFYMRHINMNNKQITASFKMTSISKNEKKQIYSSLEMLSNCLTISGITFWIISGTILGSVRHGEMIPWDDDADIAIFEVDLDKVLEINKVINNFGYEIAPHWLIYKFRKIGQEYPFIDIFCYKKQGDTYIMNHEDLIEKWPNEYYKEDELFPLISYRFGSLNLPGPSYPLAYLDRMYPKWQILGIQGYDHKRQEHMHEEIQLDQEEEHHRLLPYRTIRTNNKKDLDKFMRKKYKQYHNRNILIFK